MKKFFAMFIIVFLASITSIEKTPSQVMGQDAEEVQDIFVEQSEYTLSRNGMGAFFSVYAHLTDGTLKDITYDAECISSNENIVTVYSGTIRAEGKGTAEILITYNGYTTAFSVTVEKEIDLDNMEKELLQQAGIESLDNVSYQKTLDEIANQTLGIVRAKTSQEILNKAVAMKNIEWTPTKELDGWDHLFTLPAEVKVTGIPYSQDVQVDDIEFPKVLKNSDFYEGGASTADGTFCPKYGVDCSRYVSYALGITARTTSGMVEDLQGNKGQIAKIGTYNVSSPSRADLLAAYCLTEEGNALVHRYKGNHAMLIVYNDKNAEEITVYETTYKLPFMATYSYSTLADFHYLPFKANN